MIKITKAKGIGSYFLENNGAFTPFTSASLSEWGTLFLMNRGQVALFLNGDKRDEALELLRLSEIEVTNEKVTAHD